MDERNLPGLLGSVGKSLAYTPQARETVRELKAVETREGFLGFLDAYRDKLGVDEPAAQLIRDAAMDAHRWKDAHASLLRSAEQQVIERFSPSA